MKKSLIICCLATLFALPSAVFAMDHSMAGMDHGSMVHDLTGMDHGTMVHKVTGSNYDSMEPHKGMATVGEQVVDRVKAVVHLTDVKETMAKMGKKETHHFMVLFSNAKDGVAVTDGTVAVKIKYPDGFEVPAVRLMGMQGHFGGDVVLDKRGTYVFTLGTHLTDGAKRQYVIKYEIN